ncbi:MAG: glutamine synthetase family protein [Pseudomonadota bacterium]
MRFKTAHANKEQIQATIEWMKHHQIDEVECLLADITGIMRGKILPSEKFINGLQQGAIRMPEGVFSQTVTGDFVPESMVISEAGHDMLMIPDLSTLSKIPWYENDQSAQVICDALDMQGRDITYAPRSVLKNILALYHQQGWKPVVAPELEFYLVKRNIDPDLPLETPEGLSGRSEAGRQAYGIEAANDYDPVIEDIYHYSEDCNIDIDAMAHEGGTAQLEMNFNHGNALNLADQVFLFKRIVRKAAFKHQIYATFMAKPHEKEPGSSMHIHQSIIDIETQTNIFSTPKGRDSAALKSYIAGLQRYVGRCMPLFAANANSYRRIKPYTDAPINVHWGHDNRTVGLRVPMSDAHSRRVENRIPGADCNPYLAMAGTLACGYIGLTQKLRPSREITGDAYRLTFNLPRSQHEALYKLAHCKPLKQILGEDFIRLLIEVKNYEYDLFNRVISSWEREYLLLNV